MPFNLRLLFKKPVSEVSKPVFVVSGLPRSGTSMMMKMLVAGGLAPVIDHIRMADESNPKGYYEFERVKKLKDGDIAWVAGARGKVVKVISALLELLPPEYPYKVVFMRRDIDEILASQRQMLIQRGEATDKVSDDKLAELYAKHLEKIADWLYEQKSFEVLYVHYQDILNDPAPQIDRIWRYLGEDLNREAMAQVVDKNLYRQRKS